MEKVNTIEQKGDLPRPPPDQRPVLECALLSLALTSNKRPDHERMDRNLQKSITQHAGRFWEAGFTNPFCTGLLDRTDSLELLNLSHHCWMAESQGLRREMEDVSFCGPIEGVGYVWAVFDGHGDKGRLGKFAKARLFEWIRAAYEERGGQWVQVMEQVIDKLHCGYREEEAHPGGATALLCLIPEGSAQVITATLGDSEAIVFRREEGGLMAIPLSCVRDWCSSKDEKRARDGGIHFSPTTLAKDRRWPFAFHGINVSRSVGDFDLRHSLDVQAPSTEVVSHKPKVTRCGLQSGDRLALLSDGALDFLTYQKMLEIVRSHWDSPHLAPGTLVDAATSRMTRFAGDNASVVWQIIP